MTHNKKIMFMPNVALVPAPTAVDAAQTKQYPSLHSRSNFSNPLYQDLMTILYDVPRNTPIPDANNTSVEPTEVLKSIVSDITEALPFLV